MSLIRKRRAPAEDGADSDSTPRPTRQKSPTSEDESIHGGSDPDGDQGGDAIQDQQVKKMVRLALACEYRRSEIRRGDIGEKGMRKISCGDKSHRDIIYPGLLWKSLDYYTKVLMMRRIVLGSTARRGAFNKVFECAQEQLQHVFGMEMVELPAKEKVTIAQKRAAQKSSGSSTKSWIVTSTLPPAFRTPDILSTGDSSYVALYTYIVSIIMLSGGKLPSSKLDRYLRRANADESTPVASTEKLLQRLCKEGYIVKVKDSSSGEEMIDYIVGPRGRVEVGEGGVAGLVKAVYGEAANEELHKRVQRSLALSRPAEVEKMGNGVAVDGDKKNRGKPKGKRKEEGVGGDAEDESD
ncbi:MAG: hypothetical protein Q9165_002741 [Trypethelium subeluteriae]